MAVWLVSDHGYDLEFDPMVYSATDMLQPIRSLVLSRQVKIQQLATESTDVSDLVPARLGTAVHTAVEVAWEGDWKGALAELGYTPAVIDRVKVNPANPDEADINIYIERRSSKQLGKFTISGKFDFVVMGRVRDIKTTKTYNWIHGGNDHKYMMQGAIYRWLNPDIITDDIMSVDFAFTDWTPLQAQVNKDYPQQRILSRDMLMETPEAIEIFLENKLAQIEQYTNVHQDTMPLCTPEELWQNPTKYAFYRKATNKKATKLYDTMAEATAANDDIGGTGAIVTRLATPTFCKYCSASSICLQADGFRQAGLL